MQNSNLEHSSHGAGSGSGRDQAIRDALKNMEHLRSMFVAEIPAAIDALSGILLSGPATHVTREQLEAMRERAAPLLMITETFRLPFLEIAVRKFCDLCDAMIERSWDDIAPIRLHIQIMQMVSPGTTLSDDPSMAALLLRELGKVHKYLGIAER